MTQNQIAPIVLTPPIDAEPFVLCERTQKQAGEKLLALAKIVPDLQGLLQSGFSAYLHHMYMYVYVWRRPPTAGRLAHATIRCMARAGAYIYTSLRHA